MLFRPVVRSVAIRVSVGIVCMSLFFALRFRIFRLRPGGAKSDLYDWLVFLYRVKWWAQLSLLFLPLKSYQIKSNSFNLLPFSDL